MSDYNDKLGDVLLMLGRLEGKMDAILSARADDRDELAKLTVRVSSLERSRAYLLGISTIVSAIGTLLGHYIIISLKLMK